jgi:hypothetical protein
MAAVTIRVKRVCFGMVSILHFWLGFLSFPQSCRIRAKDQEDGAKKREECAKA